VFLTGANGFIGGALLRRLLEQGYCVTVSGRRRPDASGAGFVELDLRETAHMEKALCALPGFDFVIHAAGSLRADCEAVNDLGTRALLRSLGSRSGRWIQVGSAGVYRNPHWGVIDEETPTEPVNVYETSKLQADLAVRDTHPDAVILRPTMVAGAGMKGVPLRLLLQLLRTGIVPGVEADALLNLVHVNDVVDAVLRVCASPPQGGADFILSDDLPLIACLDLMASEIGRERASFRVPREVLRLGAEAGSLFGLDVFNRRRLEILENRARFSSARFQNIHPSWPAAGSAGAIADFVRGENPHNP